MMNDEEQQPGDEAADVSAAGQAAAAEGGEVTPADPDPELTEAAVEAEKPDRDED